MPTGLGTPQNTGAAASPTTAAASGLLANPAWQDQIAGYLMGEYAPAQAQAGLAGAVGGAQLAQVPSQLGVSSAEMQNQAGYSMANALLGFEGLGLSSQALATQAGTAAKQQGLEQAGYGIQQTEFPERQAQATQQFEAQQQGLQDQGAISGTLGSGGYKQSESLLKSGYGWQMADIYRQQQLSALGQQSEQVGYEGQQAGIGTAQQQLKLAAQQQGLDVQQAQSQLAFGLQQLGVQSEPEQFLTSIANAQGSGAQQLAALGSQASLIGGLGPNFLLGGF